VSQRCESWAQVKFCPVSRVRRAVRGSLASRWSCHTRSALDVSRYRNVAFRVVAPNEKLVKAPPGRCFEIDPAWVPSQDAITTLDRMSSCIKELTRFKQTGFMLQEF